MSKVVPFDVAWDAWGCLVALLGVIGTVFVLFHLSAIWHLLERMVGA